MNIFIDDFSKPADYKVELFKKKDWVHAKSVEEAKELILDKNNKLELVSIYRDLGQHKGDELEATKIWQWISESAANGYTSVPNRIYLHFVGSDGLSEVQSIFTKH